MRGKALSFEVLAQPVIRRTAIAPRMGLIFTQIAMEPLLDLRANSQAFAYFQETYTAW